MFKIKYLTIVIVASVIITYALMFYQEGEANKELILKWIDASFATGLFIASPGLLIFVVTGSGIMGYDLSRGNSAIALLIFTRS